MVRLKEYQELLGNQWLIVNCLLEMTVQVWPIRIESIVSCHKVPFLKKNSFALLSQNLKSIFSPLFVTLDYSWSNKESMLKGI